ncbi:hypothetical protein ACET3Z_013299 [Daucus carota]
MVSAPYTHPKIMMHEHLCSSQHSANNVVAVLANALERFLKSMIVPLSKAPPVPEQVQVEVEAEQVLVEEVVAEEAVVPDEPVIEEVVVEEPDAEAQGDEILKK